MNCGRDPRPIETFIRSAMRQSEFSNNTIRANKESEYLRHPTIVFISSGTPMWRPADCVNITKLASSTNENSRAFDFLDDEIEAVTLPYAEVVKRTKFLDSFAFLRTPLKINKRNVGLHDLYTG